MLRGGQGTSPRGVLGWGGPRHVTSWGPVGSLSHPPVGLRGGGVLVTSPRGASRGTCRTPRPPWGSGVCVRGVTGTYIHIYVNIHTHHQNTHCQNNYFYTRDHPVSQNASVIREKSASRASLAVLNNIYLGP